SKDRDGSRDPGGNRRSTLRRRARKEDENNWIGCERSARWNWSPLRNDTQIPVDPLPKGPAIGHRSLRIGSRSARPPGTAFPDSAPPRRQWKPAAPIPNSIAWQWFQELTR